jgi:hypothetical protein
MIEVKVADYKKYGKIVYTCTANNEDAYYISIYTVYTVNGKDVISSIGKTRLGRPVNANIFWKVTKSLLGKKRLSIEIVPNRPIASRPKLILCASKNDRNVLSYTDANSEIVEAIERADFDIQQMTFKCDFEIRPENASKITKNRKLFLFIESSGESEKYIARPAKGFSGKI